MPVSIGSLAELRQAPDARDTATNFMALCAVTHCARAWRGAAERQRKSKYSPDPEEDYRNRVFFGDTHLHTAATRRTPA